jgi:hypothetical protein
MLRGPARNARSDFFMMIPHRPHSIHWVLPMQRARTAQQARDLRLRNAAVASAAAGGRPATAGSPTGWVHPPGGRRGIRTGRAYVERVRGGRRGSGNGGSSAPTRRSSGGGGRRVAARRTTGNNKSSRRQGRNPGSLQPGGASNRASDDSKVGSSQLEADAAAGSRSFTAAPADGGGAASMPRTPMSPLDQQAPAAHDADPASFWLANQPNAVVDCKSAVESSGMTSSRSTTQLLPSQGLAAVDLQSSLDSMAMLSIVGGASWYWQEGSSCCASPPCRRVQASPSRAQARRWSCVRSLPRCTPWQWSRAARCCTLRSRYPSESVKHL